MNGKLLRRMVSIFFITAMFGCYPRGDYQKSAKEMLSKWDATIQAVSSTPRGALSGPVARLQEIKKQAERLGVPPGEKECYAYLIQSMEETIKAYSEFMRKGDASQNIQLSKTNWEKFYRCSSLFKEQRELEARAQAEEERRARIAEEQRTERAARLERLKTLPWDELKNEISGLTESEVKSILGEPAAVTALDEDNIQLDYEKDGKKIQLFVSRGKVSGFSEARIGGGTNEDPNI